MKYLILLLLLISACEQKKEGSFFRAGHTQAMNASDDFRIVLDPAPEASGSQVLEQDDEIDGKTEDAVGCWWKCCKSVEICTKRGAEASGDQAEELELQKDFIKSSVLRKVQTVCSAVRRLAGCCASATEEVADQVLEMSLNDTLSEDKSTQTTPLTTPEQTRKVLTRQVRIY